MVGGCAKESVGCGDSLKALERGLIFKNGDSDGSSKEAGTKVTEKEGLKGQTHRRIS